MKVREEKKSRLIHTFRAWLAMLFGAMCSGEQCDAGRWRAHWKITLCIRGAMRQLSSVGAQPPCKCLLKFRLHQEIEEYKNSNMVSSWGHLKRNESYILCLFYGCLLNLPLPIGPGLTMKHQQGG